MINQRKAAIVGCGFVGASIAFSLMQRGLFSELVLIDANHKKAEGEAMDLSHGLPYTASMDIYAGDYRDTADCALVIVTAARRGSISSIKMSRSSKAFCRTSPPPASPVFS